MRRFVNIIVICLVLSGISGCNMFTNSEQAVKIGLQKGDQIYMKALVPELMIQQGKTPVIIDFNGVIDKDGTLWVKASKLKEILPIFSGDIDIIQKSEPNCDGYFDISKNLNSFTQDRAVENTDQLGEQLEVNHIPLHVNSNQVDIKWRDHPEAVAIENCQVKSITVVQQVSAGEMVSSSEDAVLVDLNQVVSYYNEAWIIELDKEANVLLFKMPD